MVGVALLSFAVSAAIAATPAVPRCRLDNSLNAPVQEALSHAISAFGKLGTPLGITAITVNAPAIADRTTTLSVNVVRPPSRACAAKSTNQLDRISAGSVCLADGDTLQIICSINALRALIGPQTRGRSSPALLYVLSHEIGHVFQRRIGEYAGRVEEIRLDAARSDKLDALRTWCGPAMTGEEERADEFALKVLTQVLGQAPYRESVFSLRGSMLWQVDQIVMATDRWRQLAVDDAGQQQPHSAFLPTEFPMPAGAAQVNACAFVEDVLTQSAGSLAYPARSLSHPPLEVRLQRVTEVLQGVANALPATGGSQEFAPIAALQNDLSPILAHMYRETGVYMDELQNAICTVINSDDPIAQCADHSR